MAMKYRWGEFTVDRDAGLLTRAGQPIEASRKVLDCIAYLIQNRDRVVGYDELIRRLWGHDNVTNHQLSQVVLSSRRVIGDDGQNQRAIRTISGMGYRWVAELRPESEEDPVAQPVAIASPAHGIDDAATPTDTIAAQPSPEVPAATSSLAPTVETSPLADTAAAETAGAPPLSRPPSQPRSTPTLLAVGGAALLCLCLLTLLPQLKDTPQAGPATGTDPLATLYVALYAGNFEDVRQGIATLPPALANAPATRILEIELDFYRGRQQRAWDKVEVQMARPEVAADPVLRARLLTMKSMIAVRMGAPNEEVLEYAETALRLLDTAKNAPPTVRASALERRAMTISENGRSDEALSDLAKAHEIFERHGQTTQALRVKSNMARVWMRTGRLHAALDALEDVAARYRENNDRLGELFARNTMTRIQMELLRWDDALATNDICMQLLREAPDADRRFRALQLRAQALIGKGKLRLATAQWEEASGLKLENQSYNTHAQLLLASGDANAALATAASAFDNEKPTDRHDILYDSKDGALLLWVLAAQALQAEGKPLPPIPPAHLQQLRESKTTLAQIARGYWLRWQGRTPQAETELRRALAQSRRDNYPLRMTLAAEPLVGLLLERGDHAAAQDVFDGLRAHDPDRMDGEYRVHLMRLRLALGTKDPARIRAAQRGLESVVGERKLPDEVALASARPPAGAVSAPGAGMH